MNKILRNRTYKNAFTLVLLLLTCVLTHVGMTMLFCTLGTWFDNLPDWASYVIAYCITPLYFLLYYKNTYIRRSSTASYLIFSAVLIAIKVLGIYYLVLNWNKYMLDFEYHALNLIFPFDIVILFIIEFILDGFIIYKAIKEKGIEKCIVKKPIYKTLILLLLAPVFYLDIYYAGCAINGLNAIDNLFLNHGFGYFILLVFCLMPAINFYLAYREKRSVECRQNGELIGAILSLVILIAFITYRAIYPEIVVAVGKPLFVIDFFGSMDVGPTVLMLSNALFVVRYLIKSIYLKRLA